MGKRMLSSITDGQERTLVECRYVVEDATSSNDAGLMVRVKLYTAWNEGRIEKNDVILIRDELEKEFPYLANDPHRLTYKGDVALWGIARSDV